MTSARSLALVLTALVLGAVLPASSTPAPADGVRGTPARAAVPRSPAEHRERDTSAPARPFPASTPGAEWL